MATVQFGNALAFDMRNQQTLVGTVRIATVTQIEIVAGSYVADYAGQNFTYSAAGAVTGGTLTGFSETYGGRLVATATNLAVPATTAYQLIQSNNLPQLFATALAGNDTITGAGNNDVLVGYGGNNIFHGVHSGTDSVAYTGASTAYTITQDGAEARILRPDGGLDKLENIKSVIFSDKTVILPQTSAHDQSDDDNVISAKTIGLYRFFSKTTGTHFYTASNTEQHDLAASRPDLVYEGVSLSAVNPAGLLDDSQARAVFRFFDTSSGTHFYTMDQSEQQSLLNTRHDLTYEGTAFYADTSASNGGTAVFRFFDTDNGTHFYSSSASEVAQISATRPDLKAEGIAFYVPTT